MPEVRRTLSLKAIWPDKNNGELMLYDRMKYFRRRQFVLGPEHIDYEGWKKFEVDNGLLLTVHPDLSAVVVEEDANKAILLGYAIDPYRIELDDEALLRPFVSGQVLLNKVVSGLERLSGRFVLIVISRESSWLFHDPCGLRQAHYCRDNHGAIWCASQPEVLAERLGLAYDEEALRFRNMPAFRLSDEDFCFIGDRTPYRQIKYLLPNHYLDLRLGTVHRYWPVAECVGSLSIDEGLRLCQPILQNGIRAAAERFDLKMGLSAGCDSRKSLAAAKAVKEKVYFFTHTPMASHSADVEIPARLLPKLGIQHHKIELQEMCTDFRTYYEASATWARERHGHISYTALQHFGPEATVLNSNISEYSQVWFWLPKSRITGVGLAILKGLNHPIAIDDYQKWLDSAYPVCRAAKINILVLFELELRSRWVAGTFAECDIAYEVFNPYNNRRLFCIEMSTNERSRRGRRWDVPIKLINKMWPEALVEPINPEPRLYGKIKRFIWRSIVHKTITPWLPIVEYSRYRKLKRKFGRQETTIDGPRSD